VRNAFVGAFARSLEGSISLREVKKNLEPYAADGSDTDDSSDDRDAGAPGGGDAEDSAAGEDEAARDAGQD
jgi:hypothetical protein